MYKIAFFSLFGSFVLSSAAVHAAAPEVSAKDFQLYMSWKDGCEDPRLEKDTEAVKLRKIAKSLGLKPQDLQAVVDRVSPVAPTIADDTARSVRHTLASTVLKGRVLEVHIDAEQGHVVAGVKWRCGDLRDVEKEAAWAAWGVQEGGKIVETLAVWCVDGTDKTMFSAKIGRGGFEKIQKAAIERFASSRYIRLFENPKVGPQAAP